MGILIRKQKEVIVLTKIAKLALIALIVSLSGAFIDTIWAVYMDSFVGNISKVGFVSSLLTIVSFLSFFVFIPLIQKSNKSKLFTIALLFGAILYALIALNRSFILFIILAAILTIISTIRATSFGIIIKDKSDKKHLARNEGLLYTFQNLAWVIGPLAVGLIITKVHINSIFVFSSGFFILAFLLFKIFKIKDANIKNKTDNNLIKNFIEFFKDKDRIICYFLSGGVNFWWILIYLFIPLFIMRNNLDYKWIGYFLFAIAVPLISFEFIFSKLAGKIGFKKIFKIGFLIPCAISLICFFISNIFVILGLLILGSIGLAMLEATTEAYFFDLLKKKQELQFYGPYNTTIDVNGFLAKLIPSVLLLFLPFNYIFIIFSVLMFIFFLLSFKTKEIIESQKQ